MFITIIFILTIIVKTSTQVLELPFRFIRTLPGMGGAGGGGGGGIPPPTPATPAGPPITDEIVDTKPSETWK